MIAQIHHTHIDLSKIVIIGAVSYIVDRDMDFYRLQIYLIGQSYPVNIDLPSQLGKEEVKKLKVKLIEDWKDYKLTIK